MTEYQELSRHELLDLLVERDAELDTMHACKREMQWREQGLKMELNLCANERENARTLLYQTQKQLNELRTQVQQVFGQWFSTYSSAWTSWHSGVEAQKSA